MARVYTAQSSGDPAIPPTGTGYRVRRALDWMLFPVSVGFITNVLLNVLLGSHVAAGGLSWNTIAAFTAMIGTAAFQAFSER
jgi:hypothetical protein